ncbi:hypothetical protein [Ammoniphilus sp. YIM 78166]|uniref:hypothetical protein n=1 Tax=Ammoniphilus sp. YIM 78166 TaxID=1644106 RepID=UPI00107006D6|nr:hypothetical protein [Ammoniphilus sp. YIM 78166]
MEAGYELDQLVAHQVLEKTSREDIPQYSKDEKASWIIVEKFIKEGYRYDCYMSGSNHFFRFRPIGSLDSTIPYEKAPSLPKVICLAALYIAAKKANQANFA